MQFFTFMADLLHEFLRRHNAAALCGFDCARFHAVDECAFRGGLRDFRRAIVGNFTAEA
jgi:hypothetical protein